MASTTVLVVDDEPDIRNTVKEILQDEGYSVLLAADATEARDLRAREHPDLALLDINLKGAWLGIKACLPLLRVARGTIVNIGTTRATRPRKDLFVYGISKAGLLGLTRYVAIDLFDDGVTCNMVAPGWVDTPGERVLQARHGNPSWPEGTRNLIAPEEVGAAVIYLASKPGRRVNGEILYVDSGLHCADDVASVFNLPDDSARR